MLSPRGREKGLCSNTARRSKPQQSRKALRRRWHLGSSLNSISFHSSSWHCLEGTKGSESLQEKRVINFLLCGQM